MWFLTLTAPDGSKMSFQVGQITLIADGPKVASDCESGSMVYVGDCGFSVKETREEILKMMSSAAARSQLAIPKGTILKPNG